MLNAPIIVNAVVSTFDQYRRTFLVELSDGEFGEVGCWYYDELFFSEFEANEYVGMTLSDAVARYHRLDVARIRSWV